MSIISRMSVGIAASAALLLGGACSSQGPGEQATDTPPAGVEADVEAEEALEPPADDGLNQDRIVSVVEGLGYECEPTDRHLKIISVAIQCKGDDYMFLTANQFNDAEEGREFYETKALPIACGEGKMTEVRWATADDWMLVPGGEREKDFAALEDASAELGLEVHSHLCE